MSPRVVRLVLLAFATGLMAGCGQPSAPPPSTVDSVEVPPSAVHGGYLVTAAGCDDCHTPHTSGPAGPQPDISRRLSGHPAGAAVASLPDGLVFPGNWGSIVDKTRTAWVGSWGTSYASNLTPDTATGLGSWTEDMFIQTIRNGKHQGTGRDLLPPMPWENLAHLTDADLEAMWAFLRSISPVNNAVPDPLPPRS
jgi:hypothetical protein